MARKPSHLISKSPCWPAEGLLGEIGQHGLDRFGPSSEGRARPIHRGGIEAEAVAARPPDFLLTDLGQGAAGACRTIELEDVARRRESVAVFDQKPVLAV